MDPTKSSTPPPVMGAPVGFPPGAYPPPPPAGAAAAAYAQQLYAPPAAAAAAAGIPRPAAGVPATDPLAYYYGIKKEKVHRWSLNLSSSYKIIPQPQNQISGVSQHPKPFTLGSSVVLTLVLSDVAAESAWAPPIRMPRATLSLLPLLSLPLSLARFSPLPGQPAGRKVAGARRERRRPDGWRQATRRRRRRGSRPVGEEAGDRGRRPCGPPPGTSPRPPSSGRSRTSSSTATPSCSSPSCCCRTGHNSGKKFWEFPLFAGGCASGHRSVLIQNSDVAYLCNQMMLKLRDFYDPSKVQKGALLCFFSSIFQHKHKHNKSTMAVVGDGGAVAVIERRRLGLFWTGEGRHG
uniref:Uncharacterized protein n=1 Tax=Oryza glumipatula TaxID=40148 RepID=A0A0E0B4G6_9ORYZ